MIPDHPDVGYADFKLISVRSVLAFITFFGWGGVVFGRLGWFGLFAAIACGASMMFLTALLIMFVYRLQHSGNLKGSDFVGKRGTVYFGIPAGRAGNGKITVTAGGSTSELLAVADEELPTGSTIEVVEQLDDRKFLVRKA
jgi:membrane protein implicated in regulation of membrane protease activity